MQPQWPGFNPVISILACQHPSSRWATTAGESRHSSAVVPVLRLPCFFAVLRHSISFFFFLIDPHVAFTSVRCTSFLNSTEHHRRLHPIAYLLSFHALCTSVFYQCHAFNKLICDLAPMPVGHLLYWINRLCLHVLFALIPYILILV